ncbi:MAG TPA: hypothetical protein VJ417_16605 [Candidatus Glassbacteria bacterium]|nr:hypothetical protein [Candidatus Glassbacteria bacterium]
MAKKKLAEDEVSKITKAIKNLQKETRELKCAVLTLALVQLSPRLDGFKVSPHDEVFRLYQEFVREQREE